MAGAGWQPQFRPKALSRGLEHPWGWPGCRMVSVLITRASQAACASCANGCSIQGRISGVPEVLAQGQRGACWNVAVDPDFERNRFIYLSLRAGERGGQTAPGWPRARIHGQSLSDLRVIYAVPRNTARKPSISAHRLLWPSRRQPAGVDRRWRKSAAANVGRCADPPPRPQNRQQCPGQRCCAITRDGAPTRAIPLPPPGRKRQRVGAYGRPAMCRVWPLDPAARAGSG